MEHLRILDSWMRMNGNERQEIAKPIIAIFVFVLNLEFLVWI